MIYLNFAKAYEKVDRGISLHRVQGMGISGKLGTWLSCFLTDKKQVVMSGGVMTQPSTVCPQWRATRASTWAFTVSHAYIRHKCLYAVIICFLLC